MKLPIRASVVAGHLLIAATLLACDKPQPTKDKPGDSKPTATAKVSATAEPPKPKGMPELSVDTMGPYLGGTRVDLSKGDGPEKLTQVIKALPIEGKPVTLTVDKKAKTPYVAAVVYELGNAGAPKVTIKTDGRDDVPKELTVVPEMRMSSAPPACSVAAAVMKDLSTAVWPFAGGLGKRQRKGFAGPDLSHTAETLEKQLSTCNSTTAFFSADDSLEWEMAYNIGGTLIVSDKNKKIDTLVLPRETPVAGRSITLKK